jgi:hypothetical protein
VHGNEYSPSIRRYVPDLINEILGIAHAAGVAEDIVLGMNLMDEEWALRRRGDSTFFGEHCTSLGQRATAELPTLIAQNMDLARWLDGVQVVLDLASVEDGAMPAQPAALVPSVAGMIGLGSLNEHGLGVAVNGLPHLPTSPFGLPVAFVIRLLARQHDVPSACALLRAIPHATGQHYMLGDRHEIASMECSTAGVDQVVASGPGLAHANHSVANRVPLDHDPSDLHEHLRFSHRRQEHATGCLEQAPFTIDGVKQLLSEPPILRGREDPWGNSLYGVVMACSSEPSLHMSLGEPQVERFATYSVRAVGA